MSQTAEHSSRLHSLAKQYNTDKAVHVEYLSHYSSAFKELENREVKLLELGIKDGGSLLLWRDFFERGVIAGLDINPVTVEDNTGRIHTYQGPQQDIELLDQIGNEIAPDGFDVIIDDCSHIGVLTRVSFWHLFDHHLKSGGLYIIEDWGTGYWDDWVDGVSYRGRKRGFSRSTYRLTRALARLQQIPFFGGLPLVGSLLSAAKASVVSREFNSHNYGMVGFIKELVDELGVSDIASHSGGPEIKTKFREVRLYPSHMFITKI